MATGFPTTVNPILQNGCVPVFMDVELQTYNVDVTRLEAALSDRTRAVMIAHTLGNPFDLDAVTDFCARHDLWLVEDCCDAVGAEYRRPESRHVRRSGDDQLLSRPSHHDGRGRRGADRQPGAEEDRRIVPRLGPRLLVRPGKDNTCGKRFDWQLGDLPHGYDHKYIYSHIGYNLKLTDMQAAVGVSQMASCRGFVEARRANFAYLRAGLEPWRIRSSCRKRRRTATRRGSASPSPSARRRRSAAIS